jgi:hypothetical protein
MTVTFYAIINTTQGLYEGHMRIGKLAAIYSMIIGIAMLGMWTVFVTTGQVPELSTEPIRVSMHIIGEVVTALVLIAGGIGLLVVGARIADEAAQPLHALGVLAIALGLGFLISAIVSFVISQRLGLIERGPAAPRTDPAAEAEGRR